MDIICDMYNRGMSGLQIAKELGIKEWKVYDTLNKKKIKIRNPKESHQKEHINEDYFEEINSEKKAYMLGFIMADGTIVRSRHSSARMKIDIKKEDGEDIFPVFCNEIGRGIKTLKEYVNKGTYGGECRILRFYVNSDKICVSLEKYGIVERKTFKIKMPPIPKDMLRHFIRGYFDGDGCITYGGTAGWVVKIVGTESFLLSILSTLEEEIGISSNRRLYIRHKDRVNNIRSIEIGGKKQIMKLRHYFYDDATIFLSRKKEKFYEV